MAVVSPFEEQKTEVEDPFTKGEGSIATPFEQTVVSPFDKNQKSLISPSALATNIAKQKITPGAVLDFAKEGIKTNISLGRQAVAGLFDIANEAEKSLIDVMNSLEVNPRNPFVLLYRPVLDVIPEEQKPQFLKSFEDKAGSKLIRDAFTKEKSVQREKARAFVKENIAGDPTTFSESAVRTGTKFIGAFIGFRKFLLANKVISASKGTVPRLIRFMGPGAMADFTVFDPHEERVSNLVEKVPGMSNPVTRFLMAKEDDTKIVGRLKQVAEGAGINILFEGTLRSLRFVRNTWQARREMSKGGMQVLTDNNIIQSIDIEAAKKGTIPATKGRPEKILVDTDIAAAKAEVPRQVAKESGDTVPLLTKKVTVAATEKAIEATKSAVARNFNETEKISKQVAESLRLGEIRFDDVPRILQKYGLSETEFADALVKTASYAGTVLNRFSQIAKKVRATLGPEAGAILDKAAREGPQNTGLDVAVHTIRTIENFRRGLLVTQLTTAVRNTLTQAPRLALGALDEAIQTVLLGVRKPQDFMQLIKGDLNALHSVVSPFIRGGAHIKSAVIKTQAIGQIGKETVKASQKASVFSNRATGETLTEVFTKGKTKAKNIFTGKPMVLTRLDEVLDEGHFALESARLLNQPVHEVMTSNRGLSWYLNVFNRTQEMFFRKIAFEAKLRQNLIKKGLDFDTVDPSKIPVKDFKQAVDYALEMTFARSPKGEAARSFVRSWNDLGLTTVNPFPRFAFANALPFVWEHSPLGLITTALKSKAAHNIAKKTGSTMLRNVASGSSEEFSKSASRATLGTLMLMSAWSIRQSVNAGDKWYEIVWDGSDGKKVTLDTRTFAPLSTSLFIAAAIQDKINGTNKIKPSDYAQQIIGLNRIRGTGLMVVDLFRSRDEKTSEKLMSHFAGQYIGSFGVPFKTVKDIVAQYSTEEAILRNTREDPLFAPFKNNVPFLSRTLPEATSPFKNGIDIEGNLTPIRIDNNTLIMLGVAGGPEIKQPLGRQIFGLTLRVKNPIEQEISRLDLKIGRFFPKTGNQKANRLIAGYMGYLSETFAIPMVQSPEYNLMNDAEKKQFIEELYLGRKKSRLKRTAARMFAANHPDLALRLRIDKIKNPILHEEIDLIKDQILGQDREQ